jgi:hypothetical protein
MSVCRDCRVPIEWTRSRAGRFVPTEPDSYAYALEARCDLLEFGADGVPRFSKRAGHVMHSCRGDRTGRPPSPRSSSRELAYAELHLLPTAPPAVVKAAFRVLTLISHPDRGGSNDAQRRLNAAYAEIGGER